MATGVKTEKTTEAEKAAAEANKITKMQCPAGSQPVIKENLYSRVKREAVDVILSGLSGGLFTFLSPPEFLRPDVKQEPQYCIRTATNKNDCNIAKGEQLFPNEDKSWGCFVPPESVTRAGDLCINTYPLNKNGACNSINDIKVNCGSSKGIVCSKGGGAIGGKVHEYVTSYPIPCNPNFGGCPSDQTPAGYIARLYQFGLMIAGLAAFGSIIYGSLLYVLSAGNVGSQQDARDQITQALLGLTLLLGAYLILYTINPELVNLKNPKMEPINIKGIIQAAEPENTGEQRLITGGGGGGGGDPLCQTSINANIGVNATNIPGVTSGEKTSGPICLNCKENAHRVGAVLGVGGTCECDMSYKQNGSECIYSGTSFTSQPAPEKGLCPPGEFPGTSGKCVKQF